MNSQFYNEEYVLVLDTVSLWNNIGYFEGFSADFQKFENLMRILEKAIYKKRKEIEDDPKYKQIIPYVLLFCNNNLFSYRRGKLLNEERLLGNYSIGIGGHISTQDINLFTDPYKEAMEREVKEEVIISSKYKERVIGLINDDSNDVGKVHFGIVHLFDLCEAKVKAREKSINEANFVSLDDIVKYAPRYENWSQICIQNLNKIIS
jgi:predicted NUDIX family phosphoesterase